MESLRKIMPRQSSINGHPFLGQDEESGEATETPAEGEESEPAAEGEESTEESGDGESETIVPELTREERYQKTITNFKYFNRGFEGDNLALNFTECGESSIYWFYWELQTYRIKRYYGNY